MKQAATLLVCTIPMLGVVSCSTSSHIVSGHVRFSQPTDPFYDATRETIAFGFTVTNLSDKTIPDLRPSHVQKHAVLRINGRPAPFAQGGLYRRVTPEYLAKGEAETTKTGGPVANALALFGKEFTVQWEYLGVKSQILRVNIPRRTVEKIR